MLEKLRQISGADYICAIAGEPRAIVMAFGYRPYALMAGEVTIDAYYPAFQASRAGAMRAAEYIRAMGYSAEACPNIPHKPLLAASGEFFYGRNSLVGNVKMGTRCAIQVILTDAPFTTRAPAPGFTMADECKDCARCKNACPVGAIGDFASVDQRLCLRALPYDAPIPPALKRLLGASLYGCDICQRACPRNARVAPIEPPEELRRALRLEALLAGEYKQLIPYLGANYARRRKLLSRAVIIARNLGRADLIPNLDGEPDFIKLNAYEEEESNVEGHSIDHFPGVD